MGIAYGTQEWENVYSDLQAARSASATSPYILGTPEWTAIYEKLVQDDTAYKEAARTWEGSVVICVAPNPNIGISTDLCLLMDLWHGDCRSIRIVPTEVGKSGDFVLNGTFGNWKAVMTGKLDVTKGMMTQKIFLQGDLEPIMKHLKAATRLVELVSSIDTKFHDELTKDEMEYWKEWVEAGRELGL